ncbi:MAG: hypothetical protein KGO02_20295 [Alphaproteobacteria bacterium]|nr:hypothetical protein [Alphaproteobacteria bacterium]
MTINFNDPIKRELSKKEANSQVNLFQHRAALFFTSTKNIPIEFVKGGILDVIVPRVIPNLTSTINNSAYRSPRLWVDELQQSTGAIRWSPMSPAKVTICAYNDLSVFDMSGGGKALLDALKVSTHGRSDGKLLYYFGAIEDDSPLHIELDLIVDLSNPKLSGCTRVIVKPIAAVNNPGIFRRIT